MTYLTLSTYQEKRIREVLFLLCNGSMKLSEYCPKDFLFFYLLMGGKLDHSWKILRGYSRLCFRITLGSSQEIVCSAGDWTEIDLMKGMHFNPCTIWPSCLDRKDVNSKNEVSFIFKTINKHLQWWCLNFRNHCNATSEIRSYVIFLQETLINCIFLGKWFHDFHIPFSLICVLFKIYGCYNKISF